MKISESGMMIGEFDSMAVLEKISFKKKSSKPEEFHLQLLTDSVREPLDSYGSCRPSH